MSKPCTVIGITGGIATGKTAFLEALRELVPGASCFDADQAARDLADRDPEVRGLIEAEFGPSVYSAGGDLNREAIRSIVFTDAEKKRALEQILHPRIRRQWAAEADLSRQSGKTFLADIPLLYETEGETLCDRVVVVACSQEIQLQRLMARTHLSPADARAMISAQMPLPQKISRADHVAWNNGPLSNLDAQAATLARFLARK
jgi:dephospho-CoA kinase